MTDGLYRVVYKGICCGFVVEGGKMVRAAPIVWSQRWLIKYAERIGD